MGAGKLPSPTIIGAMCDEGGGTSGSSLRIEVFSDRDGQGRFYEISWGSSSGSFAFSLPAGDLFHYPYVTLTATDTSGNTSECSGPVRFGCPLSFLPVVMKRY